jgi:uncharacterized membrane protein
MKKYISKINYGIILVIVGSIFGFIIENVRTCIIKDHCILRQGLLYGPFIPVYGAGLLVLYLVYSRKVFQNKNKFLQLVIAFVLGFVLGSAIEFIFSYAQEKIFGTISWSYAHLKYNLFGRISLKHASLWGLLGVIFSFAILPLLVKFKDKMNNKNIQIIISIISVLFILDIIISSLACYRATERRKNIPAQNIVDRVCDKYFPDEYLNKIYTNARVK